MKRWKIISCCLFIIGVFTTYYVQAIQETNAYPTFILETTEGNIEDVQAIKLYGDYVLSGIHEPFLFSLTETQYAAQAAHFERLNGFYQSTEMERLLQEYPSFMRGKDYDQSMYTESDTYIVHGEMNWGTYTNEGTSGHSFKLTVHHKELDKHVHFNIPVPEADQQSFQRLEKMYAVGERLHLVTSHEQASVHGGTNHEIRIYTVELDRGKISRMDMIYAWDYASTEESSITPIENKHSIVSDQRMLLLKRVSDIDVEIEEALQITNVKEGTIDYELLAYDFRTKGVELYALPEEIKDGARFISYEENSTIYSTQLVDDELEILTWKLGEEDQLETIVAPIEELGPLYTASKIDDYMYILVQTPMLNDRLGELHILDIPSGDWIYKGYMVSERPLTSDEEVIIHAIE